jgi:D-alanyl-D-alanine carboxypeptidase
MRKINKRKRRTIIIVTVLILIVFGAYLIIENINNDKLPPIDHEEEIQEEEASNEPEPAEEEPMEPEEPDEPEEPIEPEEPAPNQEAEGVEKGILIENPDSLDVIVNKKRNLPENYVPEDLTALTDIPTVLSNPEVNQLRKAAYEALKELFDAAKEEGYELHARSGYRSYYTQASLYTSYVENYGKAAADKYSAKPGQSEHQTGLSMDITCEAINYKLDTTFGETPSGRAYCGQGI